MSRRAPSTLRAASLASPHRSGPSPRAASTGFDFNPNKSSSPPVSTSDGSSSLSLPSSSPSKDDIVTRILSAANPNVNRSIAFFDFPTREFKPLQQMGAHLQVHFVMESSLLHAESDEAKEQLSRANRPKPTVGMGKVDRGMDTQTEEEEEGDDEDEDENAGDENEDGDDNDEDVDDEDAPTRRRRRRRGVNSSMGTSTSTDSIGEASLLPRRLKNQFNFSDRSCQIFTNPLRDRQVATEPPPMRDFNGSASRWEIFDAYVEDVEKSLAAKREQEKPRIGQRQGVDDEDIISSNRPADDASTEPSFFPRLAASLKIMERLVNQNSDLAYFHDYKYYEDTNEVKIDSTGNAVVSSSEGPNTGGGHAMTERGAGDGTRNAGSGSNSASNAVGNMKHQLIRGSFLPLWKFSHHDAKRRTVTSIAWNPAFNDLFAVSYGSYEFMKQHQYNGGLIACFTLKNTHVAEYEYVTPSSCMCCQFHPHHPSLLICGLYDGTVCVYDVSKRHLSHPIYSSTDPKTHHTDPVWAIHCAPDTESSGAGKNINFYSISTDGRIVNWIMGKKGLLNEEVVGIKLMDVQMPHGHISAASKDPIRIEVEEKERQEEKESPSPLVPTASSIALPRESLLHHSGGTTFDFNPHLSHLFIVGTEEGHIHLYSKAFHTQYIRSYVGHSMSVYTVRWNPFHPGVFLSGSADWMCYLWEINNVYPIMSFDMGNQIGDISWSPYSSTVFAAVIADGKCKIFDLSLHLHAPIGEIQLLKKCGCSKIAFNKHDPIILVGDERGVVHSLKLSGNLRRTRAPTIDELDVEEELDALDKILILPDRGVGEHPEYLKQFFEMKHREENTKSVVGVGAVKGKGEGGEGGEVNE